MSKEVAGNVEGMETRGRAKKASRSRDILSALEDRVVTLENFVGDIKERIDDVDDRLHDGLQSIQEQLKVYVLDKLEQLTGRDDAIKAMDCPKKAALTAIEAKWESDVEDNNLGSILGGVKDRMSHGLMFVDIIVAGKKLNAIVDTGAFDLFMSEEAACKLGLKIDNEVGRIKTVNSKSVPIKEVAKGVDLQLGEWSGKVSIKLSIRILRVFTQTFLSKCSYFSMAFVHLSTFILTSFFCCSSWVP
ncbi:hypothetical protein Gotur_001628 [Gossypium turneri]